MRVTKSVEVSARSFFGQPSQMDKTIAKYEALGWELTDTVPAKNNKYLLRFERQLTESEIAAKDKADRIVGFLVFLAIVVVVGGMVILGNRSQRQVSPTSTPRNTVAAAAITSTTEPTKVDPTTQSTLAPVPATPTTIVTNTVEPTIAATDTAVPSTPTSTPTNTPHTPSVATVFHATLSAAQTLTATARPSERPTRSVPTATNTTRSNPTASRTSAVGRTGGGSGSGSSPIAQPTQCTPSFRASGVDYRRDDRYTYDGGNYLVYTYVPIFDRDYEIRWTVYSADDWNAAVFVVGEYNPTRRRQATLFGIPIYYVLEGTDGSDRALVSSFENGNRKFNVEVAIYGPLTGSHLDDQLWTEFSSFLQAIMIRC